MVSGVPDQRSAWRWMKAEWEAVPSGHRSGWWRILVEVGTLVEV